jgi:CBS domain-containing protein
MPTVADLITAKGSRVYTIAPSATVLEAIRRMNDNEIGALLVVLDGKTAGMFTERDVLRRVMHEMRPPASVRVDQVMTREVIWCGLDTSVEEAARIMKIRHIRHLPVCDREGNLYGLISIGDLNAFYVREKEQTIDQLTNYVYGRA